MDSFAESKSGVMPETRISLTAASLNFFSRVGIRFGTSFPWGLWLRRTIDPVSRRRGSFAAFAALHALHARIEAVPGRRVLRPAAGIASFSSHAPHGSAGFSNESGVLPCVRTAGSPSPCNGATPFQRWHEGCNSILEEDAPALAATARPTRLRDLSATAPPNDVNCSKCTMTRTRTDRCPNPAGRPSAPGRAPEPRAVNGRKFRPASEAAA